MRPLSDLQWQIIHKFGEINVALPPAGVSRDLGRKVKKSKGYKEFKLTDSQRVTIHRSLRSLVTRGLMQVNEKHRYNLTDAGLALADTHFPGLAEARAIKTAEWEQLMQGMRQMAASLPARPVRRRRSQEERAQAHAAMVVWQKEQAARRKDGQT